MSRVILNPQLRSELSDPTATVEFCDQSGNIIGHFVPEPLYREMLVAWSKVHLSDEELARRRQEPRGRTLSEIWKSLGQS
jgi:CRISPR/Cas system-associated endonuclease Cas1